MLFLSAFLVALRGFVGVSGVPLLLCLVCFLGMVQSVLFSSDGELCHGGYVGNNRTMCVCDATAL